jgi:hypothetical protein
VTIAAPHSPIAPPEAQVAIRGEARPLTDEERQVLDERLKAIEADPRPARVWSAVRDELLR